MGAHRDARGRDREMALSTAALFGAASLTTGIGLVLPHPRQVEAPGLVVLVVVAATIAAALVWWRERVPAWVYPVVAVVGTALVSLALYCNGERRGGPVGSDEMYYLWVVIWAAYYFNRRVLALQVATVLIAYTVTLAAIHPDASGTTRWISLSGLVVGAALVVRMLSERGERLVADLRQAALTDPLTALANRRGLELGFAREADRHARDGRPFALLLLDLDSFKLINDAHGHKAGDRALIAVAELLRAEVRDESVAARIGGDEFALLLARTDAGGAAGVQQRLERAVDELAHANAWPGAASIGVSVGGIDGDTLDELMHHADARLYVAKRSAHAGATGFPRLREAS